MSDGQMWYYDNGLGAAAEALTVSGGWRKEPVGCPPSCTAGPFRLAGPSPAPQWHGNHCRSSRENDSLHHEPVAGLFVPLSGNKGRRGPGRASQIIRSADPLHFALFAVPYNSAGKLL